MEFSRQARTAERESSVWEYEAAALKGKGKNMQSGFHERIMADSLQKKNGIEAATKEGNKPSRRKLFAPTGRIPQCICKGLVHRQPQKGEKPKHSKLCSLLSEKTESLKCRERKHNFE